MIVSDSSSKLEEYVGSVTAVSGITLDIPLVHSEKHYAKVEMVKQSPEYNVAARLFFKNFNRDKFPIANYSLHQRHTYCAVLFAELLLNKFMYANKSAHSLNMRNVTGSEGGIITLESESSFDVNQQLNPFHRFQKGIRGRGVGFSYAINTEFPVSFEKGGRKVTSLYRFDGIYSSELTVVSKLSVIDKFFEIFHTSPSD